MDKGREDAKQGCLVEPGKIGDQLDFDLYDVCLTEMADAQWRCACQLGTPEQKLRCTGNACIRHYNECTARKLRIVAGCQGLIGKQINVNGNAVLIDEAYCTRKGAIDEAICSKKLADCYVRLNMLTNPQEL